MSELTQVQFRDQYLLEVTNDFAGIFRQRHKILKVSKRYLIALFSHPLNCFENIG